MEDLWGVYSDLPDILSIYPLYLKEKKIIKYPKDFEDLSDIEEEIKKIKPVILDKKTRDI